MSRETNIDEGQRAAQEAAAWLVRLDSDDCSAAELGAFERWRSGDPLHAVAYRQAEAMWRDSSAVIRDSLALSEAARQALRRSPEYAPRRWWRPAASLAAVAAVAVAAILYGLLPPHAPPVGTRYATAVGEQRKVVLTDHSVLTLDTQTALVERYSPRVRRVDLLQGQAQFEVQGDPARPFVVHVNNGTVTAIGTRFQVRVADAGATITLLKGVVHVMARAADGSEHIDALQAGQRIGFDANGRFGQVELADVKAAEGWLDGKLYVDDWSLQNFAAEFNRYSTIHLRIDDPALAQVRISGVFQTRDRDNLQRLLAEGWGIRSRQIVPNEILLTRQ